LSRFQNLKLDISNQLGRMYNVIPSRAQVLPWLSRGRVVSDGKNVPKVKVPDHKPDRSVGLGDGGHSQGVQPREQIHGCQEGKYGCQWSLRS
jgi:hypothetical protein